MRILLDCAIHDHRNIGNNALVEIALQRLRAFWPGASFDVLSISPSLCRAFFEDVRPVNPYDLQEARGALDRVYGHLPQPLWRELFELREELRTQGWLVQGKTRLREMAAALRDNRSTPDMEPGPGLSAVAAPALPPTGLSAVDAYPRLGAYDLFVTPGGGYMCDSDKRFLMPMLDRLEAATKRNIPTVMVGEGVGPLTDPELCARMRQVLPAVDYIMIREERIGRPLLASLDVPMSKVIMTGDDAIELAYAARRSDFGSGLGVSLRISSYFATQATHLDDLRLTVQQAASRHAAELVEVPMQLYWNEADSDAIAVVTKGYQRRRTSPRRLATSAETIKQIGRCRVVISSTFHGAVLALGQGIPVVALVKSAEYTDKLVGLAAEFGTHGCQVVNLNATDAPAQLDRAIEVAWHAAEELRTDLLASAQRQIALAHHGYQKIFELVESV